MDVLRATCEDHLWPLESIIEDIFAGYKCRAPRVERKVLGKMFAKTKLWISQCFFVLRWTSVAGGGGVAASAEARPREALPRTNHRERPGLLSQPHSLQNVLLLQEEKVLLWFFRESEPTNNRCYILRERQRGSGGLRSGGSVRAPFPRVRLCKLMSLQENGGSQTTN